jgi:hypothetical protein
MGGKKHGGDESRYDGNRLVRFLEKLEKHEKYENGDATVQENIHQMETPGAEAEDVVARQIHDVHHGTVVARYLSLEFPHAPREHLGDVSHVPDPAILEHLKVVVHDETVEEGVEINYE